MKKGKLKKVSNTAKKAAKKAIELRLINELQEITANLGETGKKIEKEIKKGAQKLARKISASLNINMAALLKKAPISNLEIAENSPAKIAVKKQPAVKSIKIQ